MLIFMHIITQWQKQKFPMIITDLLRLADNKIQFCMFCFCWRLNIKANHCFYLYSSLWFSYSTRWHLYQSFTDKRSYLLNIHWTEIKHCCRKGILQSEYVNYRWWKINANCPQSVMVMWTLTLWLQTFVPLPSNFLSHLAPSPI